MLAALIAVFGGSTFAALVEVQSCATSTRRSRLAAHAPTITWCWIILLLVLTALASGIELTLAYR